MAKACGKTPISGTTDQKRGDERRSPPGFKQGPSPPLPPIPIRDKKCQLKSLVEKHLPDQRATFTKEQFQDFVEDYLNMGETDYETDSKLLTSLIKDYTAKNWHLWNRLRLLQSFNKHQNEMEQWFRGRTN